MDAVDPSRKSSSRLHVSTLLVASERALINALDELGFAENDDRVIEHEGRFAFITCSHDADCDDLFALISELAARGETWELQFRIDTRGRPRDLPALCPPSAGRGDRRRRAARSGAAVGRSAGA